MSNVLPGISLHIAPDGDDDGPGTRDKPFATLERARQAARERTSAPAAPITVVLRGGTYYLTEPLVLTSQMPDIRRPNDLHSQRRRTCDTQWRAEARVFVAIPTATEYMSACCQRLPLVISILVNSLSMASVEIERATQTMMVRSSELARIYYRCGRACC